VVSDAWSTWAPRAFALGVGALLVVWSASIPTLLPPITGDVVATAGSLLRGQGFEVTPDRLFVTRPPLHPVILAALGGIGLSPRRALVLQGAAAFSATLLGLVALCRAALIPAAWPLLALGAVFAPSYFLLRAGFPDAILIAASLFAVAALVRHAAEPSVAALAAVVVSTLICVGMSFFALFTVFPLATGGLLLCPGRSLRRRSVEALGLAVGVVASVGVWVARSWYLTGHLSGMSRTADRGLMSKMGFIDHLGQLAKTAIVDLVDPRAMGISPVTSALAPDSASVLAGVLVFAALAVPVVAGRSSLGAHLRRCARERSATGYAWALVGAYCVIYLVGLLAVWTFTNNDPIQTRYLAPVYPFLMVLGALVVLGLGERPASRRWRGLVLALVVGFALVQAWKVVGIMEDRPSRSLLPIWYRHPVPDEWAPRNEWTR